MASYSAASSVHKTLTSTTADTVSITDGHDKVEVVNRHATEPLYFTIATEGNVPTTAVAAADNTTVVPAGLSITVESPGKRGCVISIVGDGNPYSVQKVTG